MINSMKLDRFGALCCARSVHPAFETLAELGSGAGVNMRRRVALVVPAARPTPIAAPQTYLDDFVSPSAALHERSP